MQVSIVGHIRDTWLTEARFFQSHSYQNVISEILTWAVLEVQGDEELPLLKERLVTVSMQNVQGEHHTVVLDVDALSLRILRVETIHCHTKVSDLLDPSFEPAD
ncbi:MAG: hypothetical protein SP1CHLAM54_13700 [Chlamydiia bacterium]|nr:hypothetical protein [Chlamydiia bacterium]MCH9616263.1 hypothetical protein [Chlamydiia bacterium]MCH9629751.1 hypothetical protein [Chlamydiia bacterium]